MMGELRMMVLMIIFVMLNACEEPEQIVTVERHRHVQLKVNESYTYRTGSWETVKQGRIVFEPDFALESYYSKDSGDVELLYRYTPQKDYVGTDWVKLEFGTEGLYGTEALKTTVGLAITISE